MANYNKSGIKKTGTLIGNWQEERDMKDLTGTTRAIVREHIPKKWGNLEDPITHEKKFDITQDRIHGQKIEDLYFTETNTYDASLNPADAVPRQGMKKRLIQAKIQAEVDAEMADQEAIQERIRRMGYYDTSYGGEFIGKDLTINPIGRKIMKTIDNKPIDPKNKDEQFGVETGLGYRTTKTKESELDAQVPKGLYTETQPVTIYTQHMERKNFYMSAGTGPNPFARTCGMTRPVQETKAVRGFEGNVDFARETMQVDNYKYNADLIEHNQYNQPRDKELENLEVIKAQVIDLCKARSANGLRGLRLMFKAMDRDRSHNLDPVEFKYAMRDYGLPLSEDEITAILKYFDKNKDGKISFDEFLTAVRGDLNERRSEMVMLAFAKLDKTGDGQVTLKDLVDTYDVSYHPDFQSGIKTKNDILEEFMKQWETQKVDGIVTPDEFKDYYKDISASIDNDDYFELMIRNAWHISGGEGWCANTTNKRVLMTNPDGSQYIKTIKDDLGKDIKGGYGRVDV